MIKVMTVFPFLLLLASCTNSSADGNAMLNSEANNEKSTLFEEVRTISKRENPRQDDEGEWEYLIDIPEGLFEYSESLKEQKYPAHSTPDWVYGNEDGSVSIGITFAVNEMEESELLPFISSTKESMIPLGMQWLSDEIATINGDKCAIMKFYSPSTDGKIWNMMVALVHEGYLTLMSFNCLEDRLGEWKHELIKSSQSVQIKG